MKKTTTTTTTSSTDHSQPTYQEEDKDEPIGKVIGDDVGAEDKEKQEQEEADRIKKEQKDKEEIDNLIKERMDQYANAMNDTLAEIMNGGPIKKDKGGEK